MKPSTTDSRSGTSELENIVVEETPQPKTMEQREARRDREMQQMREALHSVQTMLQSLTMGDPRSTPLVGYETPPIASPQQQTPIPASTSVETSHLEKGVSAPPCVSEALLPPPPQFQRFEPSQSRFDSTQPCFAFDSSKALTQTIGFSE
ncbi:uncharacterized protein LOC9315101 [Arabidopsis lyrata subsp. lyrata]|uniref:uncharacterized protein LOC9315101 n=1 Tax=Arabidopsis lyrata subsp. lyrata TaxID=81972 RepID=UPI000A29E80E|nr:uncharacterized protein LOC9315101 [Arabidopsis lyrata subsp. lyrata]|eukprot:XP_020884949.1 uncharacterized protein LOC9315101 [Arabidopsis lyrata subsp. lyrata]